MAALGASQGRADTPPHRRLLLKSHLPALGAMAPGTVSRYNIGLRLSKNTV